MQESQHYNFWYTLTFRKTLKTNLQSPEAHEVALSVGDNIDKNVRPRYQRHDNKGHYFHYFHGYAVKDRIDFSHLSDKPPILTNPDPRLLLPSATELTAVQEDLTILITRLESETILNNYLIRIIIQCVGEVYGCSKTNHMLL